jgi:hypothetical protein
MTAKLTGSLREAPATVPALAALALFVIWATDQAGYPVTRWGPGGVIVLVLLAMTVGLLGVRIGELPVAVRVSLGALAAYTALSFLSILWANVPGDAWEGANRTLLYLLVFALFAGWPQRGASAALLLGGWTVALIALAVFTALRIDAAGSSSLQHLLAGGRLDYPTGYPNANAAQWLMAFWPALLLARSGRLAWPLRGLLAGGAVLLADVALLSQSRGSLFAMPIVLVLVFALLPGRVRTFALLVPVAAAIGASAPAILRVGDRLSGGAVVASQVHSALAASFAGAAVVAVVVALASALETRRPLPPPARRRAHRAVGAAAVATLLVGIVGGLVAVGDPVHRVEHGWATFKGGYGANSTTGSRLISGLGSNRYDFYRVALDELKAHPLVGIGADNFNQQYLAHGRSIETPHYPHSVEMRTLAETGVLGALLALVGLGAAMVAVAQALRRADPLGRAVAAAAVAGFGYWAIHGSVDWFWEFAGLGAPAFAMLGISCALAGPRGAGLARAPLDRGTASAGDGAPSVARSVRLRVGLIAAAALVAIALGASLAAPWLSQLEVQQAVRVWARSSRTAYRQLDDAARLNPLSDEPYLLAGSIALRYRELPHADHEFALALARSPEDAYATLERGAIASVRGERGTAEVLLERAVALDPRSELTRRALETVRARGRIDIDQLNLAILRQGDQLI